MDLKETGEYIARRVKLAGRSDTTFSDDAVAFIPRGIARPAAGGEQPPGRIADRRYAQNKSICDESSARAAVAEMTSE